MKDNFFGFGNVPRNVDIPSPEYLGMEINISCGGQGGYGVYFGYDEKEKAILLMPSIVGLDLPEKKVELNTEMPSKFFLPITCIRPYSEGTLARMVEEANTKSLTKKGN